MKIILQKIIIMIYNIVQGWGRRVLFFIFLIHLKNNNYNYNK